MRFHLLALPNTQTTQAYSLDGFAMCTIRFAQLLKELGHTVYLYASEENEAPCDELITVITKEEIEVLLNVVNTPYQYAYIEEWSPLFQIANARAIREIVKRKQPHDFICLIGGSSQKSVTDAHPDLICLEYSIGYQGSFAPFRVFESHAWRHTTYGVQGMTSGRFCDTVIPCFFEEAQFPFQKSKEDFALYVGRLIPRKGIEIVCQASQIAGIPLKIIGHGDQNLITYGEYLGALSYEQRNVIMSKARAVFCPTIYVEPFCCVAVEAQLCGTPVISTDFGGFTEIVEHGVTGYRCSCLTEFVKALTDVKSLDANYIRSRAIKKYSIHNVKHDYQRYFNRIQFYKGLDCLDRIGEMLSGKPVSGNSGTK